jgi:D-alanine-D-alanine ligase
MSTIRVAVLMGGTSSEREISLRSGGKVVAGLDPARYAVTPIDFTGDIAPIVALKGQVDVVFLALHGPGGEDGCMQGVLDLLGLPYTGSGVLGSAIAMHKGVAKALYRQAGIPTPAGIAVTVDSDPAALAARARAEVGVPCVVKPAREGSTYGISIARRDDELDAALALAARYDRELVIEEYVKGVEISVPVLGIAAPRALPAVEIVPQNADQFYDLEAKYTPGGTEEICPARISPAATAAAAEYALRAHAALCCRGVSRTDMIVRGDAVTVLETNTLPGMTETSLIPLSAQTVGISFPALLDLMIAEVLATACA